MAALGTIRKRGVILICIIGFGLFAFIAEEAFRSCESSKNDQRQQVGEVLGEKISVTDFQKLVDEYTEVIKMQQGTDNLPEEQMNQVKDMVWNTYVQSKLVENEAKELGLTVTDGELQNILNEGTNPMLLQTPFVNQQTGRFDASSLKKFLADYKSNQSAQNPQMAEQYQKIYNYWTFIEKTLRQQTLAQKYQNLLAHCFISNPVEAKMAFKEENEESSIQLASFPYSDIQDAKIKVEESDMKAKYEELKARFKQAIESRDVKYIDVQVKASSSDRLALQKQFADFQKKLAAAEDPTEILHKSGTSVNYLGIPVAKDAFPTDIAAQLDSMAVGSTSAVKANAQDNTLNIIKLIAKQELPDSIQFRTIQVSGATPEAAHKTADSIYTALQGGAEFEALAKKYGQTGEKTWMTTKQYQFAPSMDKDTKTYISALNNAAVNSYENIALGQGNVILQVVDKKGMINKYTAAVIKKTIDFSQDTYRAAYNKISSFVSANQNGEDLLKNAAKNGYTVQEANDMTTSLHYVANIHSTRDALKWVFDADEKEESPLYECGDNDHLLVMVLNKIHRAGYRDLSDPQVREMVKAEVIKDKKAEQIIAKVKGVKSIAAAKAKGAKVAPVNQVTFAAPVFIASVGASEPALSGAVSATAKGKFVSHPVKGNAGVYLFQVTNKKNRPVKFDEKAMEQKLRQRAMQYAGNFMNELYLNAKVVDNRYLFF
ncbi:SurA N-terminal domain-containing protein [Segatella bryantii]|uniref:peptidylprolyl isomerase n=1 Tax=Segatella bryantii TaxID=77095 RepID=UPI001EDB2B0D|nr:peptidylprolyl isomerase [Segatella bryantii]UKK73058.1 SurA N-terminal domain-containing protein [Segatella bryantii]